MDFERNKKIWSISIGTATLVFFITCLSSAVIPLVSLFFEVYDVFNTVKKEEAVTEVEAATFMETDDYSDFFAEDLDVESIPVEDTKDDNVMSLSDVILSEETEEEEEDGYDYTIDNSGSFSDDFVSDDESVIKEPETSFSEESNTIPVTWKSLGSDDTVTAIYKTVENVDSLEKETQDRCKENIKTALLKAQDFMSTVDGTTNTLEFSLYADSNTNELMLRILVYLDDYNLGYDSVHALGITANGVN